MLTPFSPVLICAPLIFIGTAIAGLALYIWTCRPAQSATTLSAALAGIALWCLGYGMELGAPTLAGRKFWVAIELPGVTTVSALCFLLTLEYTGRHLAPKAKWALFIPALLTQASNWTDSFFHLYWRSVWLDHSGPIPILGREYGPGFWLHAVCSYSLLGLSLVLLVRMLLRRTRHRREQTVVFLASAMLPALVGLVYIFDLPPLKFFDCTPFAFVLTAAGMTWVLFRYRFQAIVPMAWATAVESLSEGILVLDSEACVAGLNVQAEKLLGCGRAECIGKPPATAMQKRPELIPACTSDSYGRWDLAISDGIERIFQVESLPVRLRRGGCGGRLLKIREVTVERQAARELAASKDRAVAATAAKSQFLANMSHEIRTPMNGILGMAALLQQEPLSAPAAEYASTIYASTRSLLTIINDVLDFAKIEAGKLELEHVPFDLRQCISEAIRLMYWTAGEKGIRLDLRCPDELPGQVIGDPGRLRQVILNLVGNGVKFTRAGEVSVQVDFEPRDDGKARFIIAVRDTDIGIPEQKLATLFDEFTQADPTMTRKYGGTGLGLAISKQLVEKMGGAIRVDSREGQGSCFTVDVVMDLDHSAGVRRTADTPRCEQPRDFGDLRILLAEDNRVNQKLGQRVLERLGCRVDIAGNGADAIRRAAENRYQLIFMDCQMPEVDGFEATARIRASGVETPIIALTASALEETRRACLEAGMNDYISKPVEPALWPEMIGKWIDAERLRNARASDGPAPPHV